MHLYPFPRAWLFFVAASLLPFSEAQATNPIIMDQFTADPTARVFQGQVFLYPSHDLPPQPGRGRPDWFVMEDYHVFSSKNLSDWTDHGVILRQTDVPWVNATTYSMWAPDCIEKEGRYYFYFPAVAKTGRFKIGVAVADEPAGPFHPQPTPIAGVEGIDPCVFVDKDGSPYLFYSLKNIYVVPLNPNMLEIDGAPTAIAHLPEHGLLEGPFVFERKGLYYLCYPHVADKIERLEYAVAPHPLGPYKPAGVILDEAKSGCWTVHPSVVEYEGQWYLFYHDKDLSPGFDKNRSARIDRLDFNADGTIKPVVATLRGVGIAPAREPLQIDRYSAVSSAEVAVNFLNASASQEGWKVTLPTVGAWVRFNAVAFDKGGLKTALARALSTTGATLEVRLDAPDGPIISRITVAPGTSWQTCTAPSDSSVAGPHDLVIVLASGSSVDIDWLRFD